jgi:hypothetical protein
MYKHIKAQLISRKTYHIKSKYAFDSAHSIPLQPNTLLWTTELDDVFLPQLEPGNLQL